MTLKSVEKKFAGNVKIQIKVVTNNYVLFYYFLPNIFVLDLKFSFFKGKKKFTRSLEIINVKFKKNCENLDFL